jgi:hypothetical protein
MHRQVGVEPVERTRRAGQAVVHRARPEAAIPVALAVVEAVAGIGVGSGDPYKSLRTTLRDEIDEDAWASLNSAVSRPFSRPAGGKVAVKAINHLGDEVMRVFDV